MILGQIKLLIGLRKKIVAKSKKIGGTSKNNDRAINKYKKMEHKKLYSKSIYEEKNEDNNKKLKDKFRSKSTKNIFKEEKNKK